jgi:hypothetical protein
MAGPGHDGRGDDVSPLKELILAPMGLDPAIHRRTVLEYMAGSSPAMT